MCATACFDRRGIYLLACLVLCGCGRSGPTRVPVRGTLSFDGGPPPAAGVVYFAPIKAAEGFPRRPAHAGFAKGDGNFVVTSVEPEDGLVPGLYLVNIECWRRPPAEDGTPGISWIGDGWKPPQLELKAGDKPITLDYKLPGRR
jgi:hypothetical protein